MSAEGLQDDDEADDDEADTAIETNGGSRDEEGGNDQSSSGDTDGVVTKKLAGISRIRSRGRAVRRRNRPNASALEAMSERESLGLCVCPSTHNYPVCSLHSLCMLKYCFLSYVGLTDVGFTQDLPDARQSRFSDGDVRWTSVGSLALWNSSHSSGSMASRFRSSPEAGAVTRSSSSLMGGIFSNLGMGGSQKRPLDTRSRVRSTSASARGVELPQSSQLQLPLLGAESRSGNGGDR